MAQESDLFERIIERFDRHEDKMERAMRDLKLDFQGRQMEVRARVESLEKAERYSNERIGKLETTAEITGGLAGRKEGVKWSVIIGLALNLLIQVIEKFG